MENINQPYSKKEICTRLRSVSADCSKFFNSLDEEIFFKEENGKWSPAENVKHLTLSANPVTLALNFPKVGLRIFGFPNRKSRSYEEVVQRYHEKLAKGAKASFFFVPGKKKIRGNKKMIISKWNRSAGDLVNALEKWDDNELDQYLITHPILGRLTVREMLFFTIYHIGHHTNSVRKMMAITA